MKRVIAKTIRENAAKMPIIYEWEKGSVIMMGWELNLTPFGDKRKFDPDVEYSVPMPQMRAVTHEQQMKDAYKKGGVEAVKRYINEVYNKAKNILNENQLP